MAEKVAFNTLKKLTVQDRLKVMKDSGTGALLTAALTPTDFANLFPRYYQMNDPDIGGFRAAVSQKTQSMQEKFSQAVADQLGIDPATGRRKGGWLEKMAEDYGPGGRKAPGGKDYVRPLSPLERAIKEQTGVDISAGPEQAELRGDQKKLFENLKSGRVELDDPRAAMLKKMSPNQFAAAGLKIEDVDGKQYYKMAPVEVTEEQIQKFAPGRYRPKYNLKDSDLSDEVVNTIAGEVSPNNKKGVDAVINVLLNRAGSRKYAGSSSLEGIVSAPGQFEAYNKGRPTKEQAEFIRERIRAIASGSEPDITGGANEYRAKSYVFGDGKGKHFYRDAEKQGFIDIGGNIFANRSKTGSPYASYVHSGEQPPPATLTPEQRKAAEEKAKENVLQERGQAFAAGTIEPPPGLSDKALEEFKKMPPGEQQRFSDTFYKMGGTPEASKKLNESVEKYGSATASVLSGKGMYGTSEDAKSFLRSVDVIGDSKTIMKNYGFDPIDSMNNKTSLSFANALQRYNDYAIKNGLPEARLTSGARFPLPGMPGGMANRSNSLHAGGFAGDVVFVNRQGLSLGLNKGPHDVFQKFAKEEGLFWGKEIYGDHEVHHYQSYSGKTNPYSSKYDSRGVPLDPEFLKNVDVTTGQPWINPTIIKKVEEVKKEEEQKSNVNVTSGEAPPLKPEYEPKPMSPWEYAGHKVSQKEDTTATVTKPEEKKPEIKPVEEKKVEEGPKNVTFTLNKKAYLDEIERKHPAVNAPIVGPGRDGAWKQTVEGLDAEGIKYETLKNGDIKVTLPENDARIGRVRKDMKDNDLDEKLFLNSAPASPVSDKSASVESNIQTTQTASVTKPEKSGMFDFVQTASASELDMSDPKVREAIKAHHERGIAARASTENITTPVSPSEKSAAAETTTEVKKPTGLSPNTKLIDYKSERTVPAVGATQEQYNAFREAVASIESSGGVYNKKGGAGGGYDGAYQFNKNAKKDAFRTMGGKIPSREDFRKDPLLQERAMDHYVSFNHRILMLKSEKYRNLSPEEKLKVLGYAHNQGAGGAAKWLETGKVRSDAFGTKGTKYSQTIGTHLTKLTETQKNFDQQQTQVAAVQQPVAPTPTPTPEPQKGYFESLKEKASAAVGFPTTAAAQPKPTSTPAAPEPSRKVDAPTPPHRPAEITPISQPEFPKTPKSEGPPTPPHRPAELTPQPGKPDETSTRSFLESQGIGKPEHIPVKATGGETETSTEVAAYPIGGLRGDNSVVVDTETQKPLFTMNTKTEAMVPDEENNKVNVVPTNKVNGGSIPAPAPQTSNSDFMSELNKLRDELTTKLDMAGETLKQNPIKGLDVGGDIDKDRTLLARMLSSTDNLYQTPSFKRAMMRSSAFKETDDFHGHYSQGTNGME